VVGVKHEIKCDWIKWREASGVLCDKRILMRLKGKFYRNKVRPTMLYGSESWEIYSRIEQSMSVAKMTRMSGVTRENRTRNECIRGSIAIASIVEVKMRKREMVWSCKIRNENSKSDYEKKR